ncbi:MAG: O-antigen ligase family protein [Bryobacteraceae bacterium]|nr:O-antigen ligase family protein [Bryobacteraceae bacterium]
MVSESFFGRAAFVLTFGAAAASLFSIAVCHSMMALALAALLLSGEKLRFPPIKLPLALFMGLTVASLAFSGDAAAGRPQIRKFYVFFILLLVYSVVRGTDRVRGLVKAWVGIGALSAALSLYQFSEKYQKARALGQDFYEAYIADRTTGFMSHWMTFGGHMMLVFLLAAGFILFAPSACRKMALWIVCAALVAAAIVLGLTRSIWMATGAGGIYLLWRWRRKTVLLLPVVLAAIVALGPASIRQRVLSLARPHGQLDSNEHRIVCWRTGWNMIRAHPWFGLGPQRVTLDFDRYVPPDIPRPLPEGWYGHLHNIYIHYAAERGIPAMLALMWMLGKILYDFLRGIVRSPPGDRRAILHSGVAVVIAILVAGIFELNLGDTEVLTLFLAVAACGYSLLDEKPAAAV